MANRTFQESSLALIKRRVVLYAVVDVGPGGSVSLRKTLYDGGTAANSVAPATGVGYGVGNGAGIRSVERTGKGAWTITLSDSYVMFKSAVLETSVTATGVPSVATMGVSATHSNVTLNNGVGNGGVIAVQLVDFSGAPADPTSGDLIILKFTLQDSAEA